MYGIQAKPNSKLIIAVLSLSLFLPPTPFAPLPHECQTTTSAAEMTISITNAQSALQALGVKEVSTEELLQHCDGNKDATSYDDDEGEECFLNESEFAHMASSNLYQIEQVTKAFHLIDQNDKGCIILEDLLHVVEDLFENDPDTNWTRDEIIEMIQVADSNSSDGDGILSLDHLIQIAKKVDL